MDKKETSEKKQTVADKIWEEIKDLPINMFALPGQAVSHYFKPVTIEPTKLYMLISTGAALPSLEELVRKKYTVDRVNQYIVLSPKVGL